MLENSEARLPSKACGKGEEFEEDDDVGCSMEMVKVVVVAEPFLVSELFVVDEVSTSWSFRFRNCFRRIFQFEVAALALGPWPSETSVDAGAAREVEEVIAGCCVSL